MLAWVAPFAALPFKAAFALWTALGLAIFYFAGRRLASRGAMLLALLSPAVIVGAIAGQVALFVSGLAMLALTSRRAVAAGVCFGLAATIKPQALLLLPLALIGAREYRVLGFAVLTGGALALVDLATHGMLWLDWLRATGRFADLLPLMGSALNGASPTGLVTHRHLEGGIAAAIVATGVALGTTTTWFVFRRTSDPAHRAAALGIGYILCSPYAAVYELTMMAPAAAAILLDRRQQPLTWFGAAFGLSTLGGAMAPMTFGAALLCERLRSRKPSVIPAQAGISLPDRQDQRQWDSSLRWDDRAT
jgi:multidrug transporter EmrE-like cation transporter